MTTQKGSHIVAGPHPVDGVKPGGVLTVEPPERAARLIAAGAIEERNKS